MFTLLFIIYLSISILKSEQLHKSEEKLNILLILTDDLRPELSIYGRKTITPNFKKLASRGVVFDLAYSQAPVCHPSRESLLTGMRPDATNVSQ